MKRNDIFFLTYIGFLVICFIVRLFHVFSLWNSIVSATTIASALLAVAELFSVSAKESGKMYNDLTSFDYSLNSKVVELKDQMRIARNNSEEMTARFKSFDMSIAEGYINSFNKKVLDAEKALADTSSYAEEAKSLEKRYSIISGVFTALGFLSFLCIMTFETLSLHAQKLQDMLTVGSLAIVLVTQYLGNRFDSQHRREEDLYRGVVEKYESLVDGIFTINSQMIEKLQTAKKPAKEEISNAD